ncbi:MAG TPA: hypothetical protein DD381_11320 [Lentisphaeria bacterium]|nr:MAG: hypothetical protein A2X47_12795 [Lentisphaerae bacterium GWF2_38_69]HBM16919.1 hypothetical protein [Lentisphaeria bacterium]
MNRVSLLVMEEKGKIYRAAKNIGFSICEHQSPVHSDDEIELAKKAGLTIPDSVSTNEIHCTKTAIYDISTHISDKKLKTDRATVSKKYYDTKPKDVLKYFRDIKKKKINKVADELFELYKTFCKAELDLDFNKGNCEEAFLEFVNAKDKSLKIIKKADNLYKKISAGVNKKGKTILSPDKQEKARIYLKSLRDKGIDYTRTDDKNLKRDINLKSATAQTANKFKVCKKTIQTYFPKKNFKK